MQKIGNIEIGGKISIGTFLKGNTKLKDVSIFFSNCYIFFLKVLFI
jgi:hypothetical protein